MRCADDSTTSGGAIVRRATVGDAARLAAMRADSSFERKGGDRAVRDEHVRVCTAFFERELAESHSFLRSWVATIDGEIVGAASLAVVPTLPAIRSSPRAASTVACVTYSSSPRIAAEGSRSRSCSR